MAENIHIKITGDNKDLKNKLDDSKKQTGSFADSLAGYAKGYITYQAAVNSVSFAYNKMIKPAMDAEEAASKFNTVFKSSASDVIRWSQSLGNSIGRSSLGLQSAAADMFALIDPMAESRAAAIDMSKSLVELAQDLGSFHDVDIEQVLSNIKSGITGEAEPMKKYGILLTDVALKEYAHQKGIKAKVETMDIATKTALRYQMMIDRAGEAVGDAGKTVDSTTNQVKQFEDNMSEFSKNIGSIFLPAVNSLVSGFNDLYKSSNNIAEGSNFAKGVFLGLVPVALQSSILVKQQAKKNHDEYLQYLSDFNKKKNSIENDDKQNRSKSYTDEQLAAWKNAAKQREEIEYNSNLRILELADDKLAVLNLNYQKEMEAARAVKADTSNITAYYAAQELELQSTMADQKLLSDVAVAQNEVAIKEQVLRAKLGLESAGFQGAMMFANAGAQLMSSQNKKLFKIGQVAGVANVWMNTAQAITKGYAQLGPIAGSAYAVLMGVVGGVQSANIMKQKPPGDMKNESASIAAPELPKYNIVPLAQGVFDVPTDMPAVIHQGESVMPKSWAESVRNGELNSMGTTIIVQGNLIDTEGLLQAVYKANSDIARRTGTTIYSR